MSNEQTPLLKRADAAAGNGMPTADTTGPPKPRDAATAASESPRSPQAIAHRGYKALFPENTMLAFRAAVEVGAHAVETDLHLSKDGVVVLSHDPSLKRCYGQDSKVKDHDWSYLSTLRTVREPPQPMPRLLDLLEYLNQPELQHIWIMLDIKRNDDATELVRRTAETLASVPGIRPWHERVLPCCWTAQYIKLSKQYLPEFPIAHVGISTTYARALADHVPDMSISLLYYALTLPIVGTWFLRDMREQGRPLYSWTVNDEDRMGWAVRQKLDGVITDDPKLFLDVCKRVGAEAKEANDFALPRRGTSAGLTLRRRVVRVYEWARYAVFLSIVITMYLSRNGLPARQVRKTLAD